MKLFKKIISIFLFNILMCSSNLVVKAANNNGLKSGIYNLQNDIFHSSETGRSMARTYLNPNMKMELKNGQVFFIVKFSGAQYMDNFRIIVDGGSADVNIIDKNTSADTITLKFKGNSPESKITCKIYVGPMGRDVSFNIIPKLETANLIKVIEEPKKEIKENTVKEDVSNKQNKEIDSKKNGNDEIKKEPIKKDVNNVKSKENKEENKQEDKVDKVDKDKKENINNIKKDEKIESKKEINTTKEDTKPTEEKKEIQEPSNKPVIINEEVKETIYEKINKNMIIAILLIGCVIIGGTIFGVKKFKK